MVQICFSRVCSTDSISCSEQKNWKKTRLKQGSKTKEGKSKRFLSLPIHLAYHRSTAEPLLLRCRTDIATLSLCCRSAVATLLHHYCSAVAPLSRCCHTAITPVSLHCLSAAIAPAVAPAVAPLFHRCRAVVETLSLRPREGINNSILNCCCFTVTPLSLLLSIGRFTQLSPQET